MAWTLIHAAWLHYLLAIINAHDWTTRYVTTFTTEIFSILNSIIYFHKAIQELERAHEALTIAAFLNAVIGAIGTMLLANLDRMTLPISTSFKLSSPDRSLFVVEFWELPSSVGVCCYPSVNHYHLPFLF